MRVSTRSTLLLTILAALIVACAPHREPPRAVDGVLDLRGWDFEKRGSVELDGEWHLYWRELLPVDTGSVRNAAPIRVRAPVPAAWNACTLNGEALGRSGYGTYRLRIAVGGWRSILAMKMPEVYTAYELWVDGHKVGACGVVGTSRDAMTARQIPQTFFLKPQSDTVDVRLLVSNYDYAIGGLWRSLSLGSDQRVMNANAFLNALYMVLYGILVILGGYHLWLFFNEKRGKGYLYFGALCLGVMTVSFFIGDHFLRHVVGRLPWALTTRTFMMLVALVSPLGALFFKSLWPDEYPRGSLAAIHVVCTVPAVAIAIAPMPFVHHIFAAFHVPNTAVVLFGLYIVAMASMHKREGAVYVLVGYLVHVLAILNDQLSYAGVFESPLLLTPLGLACWSLGSAIAINKRFIRTQDQVRAHRERLAQAEKMASLGTLVSGVAHEINNPNNAILLGTQLHKRIWNGLGPILDDYVSLRGEFTVENYDSDELREEIAASVDRTIRNAERIKRTVSDLRAFARKEDVDTYETVDCNAAVTAALKIIEHRTERLTTALTVALADSEPLVHGSRQRLEQVVMNLVLNACQALTKPSDAVRVSTAVDGRGKRVEITVSDEGIGMDKATLERVFDPFYTTKSRADGTGLGLSIVASIVNSHGGRIEIESEPGTGTTARVILPCCSHMTRG
ncbi:MAG: hypothetical protein GF331_15495 [Chitinivibrionales bacterium]|nr:hypothetical protein [Chitinivibrionales bacterium]